MTPEFEEAIAPVREWLVQGAPGHIEFNMSDFHCGTAMCIAGAIMEFNDVQGVIPEVIGRELGMSDAQIAQLFYWENADGEIPEVSCDDITPAMAVDAIDQMLSTGEVNWRTDV